MVHVFCMCAQSLSHVQLFVTSWTVACEAPLSMTYFQREYWTGLPFPPLGDLLEPWIEPTSPALAGGFFSTELHWKTQIRYTPI